MTLCFPKLLMRGLVIVLLFKSLFSKSTSSLSLLLRQALETHANSPPSTSPPLDTHHTYPIIVAQDGQGDGPHQSEIWSQWN